MVQSTWLLFCIPQPLRKRAQLVFICGNVRQEAVISVKHVGTYDLHWEGNLLGKRYAMKVESRRRLPGDLKDASRIQFIGRFEHEDGVSGDLTIRKQTDGELMTLGLYGTPQTIRVVKTEPRTVLCPLEVFGIAGADIRLETATDPWHRPATPPDDMPAKPGRHYYSGSCTMESQAGAVPMAALLATLTLIHTLVLIPHYMDPS